ncbi:MAG: heavy metal-binding domain-containing protein [Tissierellia bacterium]|nr:heavy metal-binding domain-containing protein [Tissierellia bacterium]
MIITTTGHVQGKEVSEYLGIVFGEVITGVNMIKDFGAGLRDIFGGRAQGYEEELSNAREQAIDELHARAVAMGADAVIACKMDYEVLGQAGSMLMVTISGTAVKLR